MRADCRKCVNYKIIKNVVTTYYDRHHGKEQTSKPQDKPYCIHYDKFLTMLTRTDCNWYQMRSMSLDRFLPKVKKNDNT